MIGAQPRQSMRAFSVLLTLTAPVVLAEPSGVPVMIGGDVELDACGALGAVSIPGAAEEARAAVRQGPGPDHPVRDAPAHR